MPRLVGAFAILWAFVVNGEEALPAPAAQAPPPADLASALDRALLLMYQGAHEFVEASEQRLLRGGAAPANAPNALDVVGTMSKNILQLREVVGKMQVQHAEETSNLEAQLSAQAQAQLQAEQKSADAAQSQTLAQLEALRKDYEQLKAGNAQLATSVKDLTARAEKCEANLTSRTVVVAKAAPQQEPRALAATGSGDWTQIQALQGLNDQLRDRLREMTDQAADTNATDTDLRSRAAQCDGKISDQQQQISTLQRDMKKLAFSLQNRAGQEQVQQKQVQRKGRLEAEHEFEIYRAKLDQESKGLQLNAKESKAVAEHLAEQIVAVQKDYGTLQRVTQELQGENKNLKEDKSQLMDSLQSMLRQSTQYQQQLLSCQQGKQPSDAKILEAASSYVGSGSTGPVGRSIITSDEVQSSNEKTLSAMVRSDVPVDRPVDSPVSEDPVASMAETTNIDKYIVANIPDAHGGRARAVAAEQVAPQPEISATPPTMPLAALSAALPPIPMAPPQQPESPSLPVATARAVAAASQPVLRRAAAAATQAVVATPTVSPRDKSHATLAAWLEGAPPPNLQAAPPKPTGFEGSGDSASKLMLGAESELAAADA